MSEEITAWLLLVVSSPIFWYAVLGLFLRWVIVGVIKDAIVAAHKEISKAK